MAQSKGIIRQQDQPDTLAFLAVHPDDDVSDTGYVSDLLDNALEPMSGMEDF